MTTRLSDGAHIGGVRLQVTDLRRSITFYRDLLGFTLLSHEGGVATLGVTSGTRPLITVVEHPGKAIRARSRLGLFHFAILVPDRASLGSVLLHLHQNGIQLGMSDHLVSEALYLNDPDGLGIEIYRDRPRAEWRHELSELAMATDPLDADSLIAEPGVGRWRGMPAGTTIGHMHLHVGDLDTAEAFYHDTIGFDITVRRYPGALFMSAGGYHHHLGVNTWARGAAAPAADEAQLLHWDLVVEDATELRTIEARLTAAGSTVTVAESDVAVVARDPFGTAVRIVAG